MAFDAFLKIDGIDGESTDKTHPGEIEVSSFSWGVSNTAHGAPAAAAAPARRRSRTSTSGWRRARRRRTSCSPARPGDHFQMATLTCRRGGAGGFEFLKIKLYDCLVSSYELGGDNTPQSTSPNSPTDSLSLNFVKIDFLYTVQRTGETVETVFDTTGEPDAARAAPERRRAPPAGLA